MYIRPYDPSPPLLPRFPSLPQNTLLQKERGVADPLPELLEHDLVRLLTAPLVLDRVSGVARGALRSLTGVLEGTDGVSEALVRDGCLRDIIKSVSDPKPIIQITAHETLRQIVRDGDRQAHAVLDADILDVIRLQLDGLNHDVCLAALRTLNALVAAGPDVASLVMGGDMILRLYQHLDDGQLPTEHQVK